MSPLSLHRATPVLVLLAVCTFSGCESAQSQARTAKPNPLTAATTPKPNPFAVADQTPEEKQKADVAGDAYFQSLRRTILEIDDGTTSPDVIARAAVTQNMQLLRAKFSAQTAHIKRSHWIAAQATQEKFNRLPEPKDIDLAANMVLRLRQQRLQAPQETPKIPRKAPGINLI